ncbi:hypothetical protein [Subtercola lobariae]|uniref:Nucleoside phosphorylase domain-containing protein n=1 Tax=Subtercola lobariae TaxID=1588641 RepID=A0A917BA11_9MICO|nr:hypothetical protein [Subtercola lobariae]GGF27919.1 hypothetical protein GCM10011399_21510 [Subtercola lobariae]
MNIDAESSTVLVLASIFGMKGGCVLGIGNHIDTGAGHHLTNTKSLAQIALNALTKTS